MRISLLALIAAAIVALAGLAVRRQTIEVARRKAIPKQKPVEIQEWEGEGGTIKGVPPMPPVPHAASI
jgi:hypothetical protein